MFLPLLTALFSIPSSSQVWDATADYSSTTFANFLPLIYILIGCIVGGLVLRFVIKSILKGVYKVTGGGRKGGRRGRR